MRPELSHAAALGTLTLAALYVGCVLAGWAIDALHPADDADINAVEPASQNSSKQPPHDTNNVYDLVQALGDPSKPHVLHAVRRLLHLSAFKDFQTQMGDFGGIEALVNLLHADCTNMDDDAQELILATLLALTNLTVHATNHHLMIAANLDHVVAAIYEESSLAMPVKLACLRLLINLAMWPESSAWLLGSPVIHTLAGDLLTSSSDDWTTGILQLFVNVTDPASMALVPMARRAAAVDSIVDSTVIFCEVANDHATPRQADNARIILRNTASQCGMLTSSNVLEAPLA